MVASGPQAEGSPAMTIIRDQEERFTLESQPFAESAAGEGRSDEGGDAREAAGGSGAAGEAGGVSGSEGFTPWAEGLTPFSEGEAPLSEQEALLEAAFEAVRDEAFDEAVGELVAETEDAVSQRFSDESPASVSERERIAAAHLAPTQFAAEQYLERLGEGLAG